MSKLANNRFDVLYSDGKREEIFDSEYAEIGNHSFGEACFNAMMLSDGQPCSVVMVLRGRDVRRWDIEDGADPDFDFPEVGAA